jgi:hypothetical protein
LQRDESGLSPPSSEVKPGFHSLRDAADTLTALDYEGASDERESAAGLSKAFGRGEGLVRAMDEMGERALARLRRTAIGFFRTERDSCSREFRAER